MAKRRPKLKTETNTPKVEADIRIAATAHFDFEPSDVFFEHGQWWVRYWRDTRCESDKEYDDWFDEQFGSDEDEALFSVVDVGRSDVEDENDEDRRSVEGFGFEKL